MNRIKKLGCALARLPRRDKQLVALCYAAFFAVSLLVSLYSFAEDRVQRALGNVTETEISAADFEWTDLEQGPGAHLYRGGEPHPLCRGRAGVHRLRRFAVHGPCPGGALPQ